LQYIILIYGIYPMASLPDIEALLPHRGNMRLIQDIIEIEKDCGVAGASVLSRWPLTTQTAVDSLISVELVAQTAAIVIGYRRLVNNKPNRIGWIVGISQARFHQDVIPLGAYIRVAASTEMTIENYTKISGHATVEDRQVAEVSLQVFGIET
jgi:predicted hotdog family 3-hydroxylacyl-ACP dehydratase